MSEIEKIKNHASGRWPEILLNLAPHISPMIERGRKHGPCPLCGGKDRARCHNDFDETGGVFCNHCDGGADGLAALQWANGWTFPESIDAVADCLGLSKGAPLPPIAISIPKPEPEKDWEPKRKWIEMLWNEAVPGHPGLQRYLEYRGLSIDLPPSLRLHKGLKYLDDQKRSLGKFPCMVARIIRGAEVVGLHVTFLDPEGPGKAAVPNEKKIWRCADTVSGGSINLFEPEPNIPLAFTEGIESALAVRELSGFPVWACGNSSLLSKVEVPESVSRVYIGADKDRSCAGERAAQNLAQRLLEKGQGAVISFPPIDIPDGESSVDWLDYVSHGQEVDCE